MSAAQVDLDYILDERLRELIIEEPRRLTLSRMGKPVERVKNTMDLNHGEYHSTQKWLIPHSAEIY